MFEMSNINTLNNFILLDRYILNIYIFLLYLFFYFLMLRARVFNIQIFAYTRWQLAVRSSARFPLLWKGFFFNIMEINIIVPKHIGVRHWAFQKVRSAEPFRFTFHIINTLITTHYKILLKINRPCTRLTVAVYFILR